MFPEIYAFSQKWTTLIKRIEYVTPELLTQFKANWACLVKSDHDCKPSYPFFHLKSSGFWKLKAKPGYEASINQSSRSPSLSDLRLMIEYAEIDAELFDLMCDPIANATLTKTLLDKFFPHHVENELLFAEGLRLLKQYEKNLLVADPIAYQIETKKLIEEDNEEEVFVRGGAFKREIPKVYQYTCAISGMRVQAAREVSLIDACHIVPFSESYDDTESSPQTLVSKIILFKLLLMLSCWNVGNSHWLLRR